MPRETKASLQKKIDELVGIVKKQSRLAEQHEEEHEELIAMRSEMRQIAQNATKGNWRLPQETLVRMYQAEDELKRMRYVLADAVMSEDGLHTMSVRDFAQGVLDGHLRTPALRVTDPNNPL